ncbi:MAG: hypothetical protein JSR82_06470 [Verrucomicrobia bacterium]|nr:hypothetical protein [Verrucomicrobiota bacterium]
MCHGTWVCFDCRTAVRRATWRKVTRVYPQLLGDALSGRVRCPHCRAAGRFLGPSVAIPPKRATSRWRLLETAIGSLRRTHAGQRRHAEVRAQHALERRLLALQSRPWNRDRARLIAGLEGGSPALLPFAP